MSKIVCGQYLTHFMRIASIQWVRGKQERRVAAAIRYVCYEWSSVCCTHTLNAI